TGALITRFEKIFNAKTFRSFLETIVRTKRRGKKIVLVLDNARYHHAIMLKEWLFANRKHILLLFLPPYSPELNNIERVWKLTRRLCTHNRYFPTLEQLKETVAKQFRSWKKPNDALRSLCCIN